MMEAAGGTGTEIGFYRNFVDLAGTRVPSCFYAGHEHSSGRFILLLEDLSAARAADQLSPCSQTDVEVVIDAMAGVHTRWWNDPELAKASWLRSIDTPDPTIGRIYDAAWPGFLAAFEDQLPDTLRQAGAALVGRIPEMISRFGEAPRTLSHGDCRLDNMFFDLPDGSPFALLDWQVANRGSGPADIAYFLGASLPAEQRRGFEEPILRRYQAALKAGDVGDYSWDALQRDYRRGMASLPLIMVIAGANLDTSMPRGQALIEAFFERGEAALADSNFLELLAE